MPELPQGTVTFLFTDIEGSTRLLQELGDRYADVLLDHHEKLRAVFERNRGIEVGTGGDAFFVAFSTAADAATAASEAQEALAGGRVKVRMGLHTGEPVVVAGDYVGLDVHRAARIAAAAHGGQVVLSERTRSFLTDTLVKDLGLHRLKDLIAPERLYQLGDDDFPPLRSLNATNLPTQPAPLIGRRREIEALTQLLAQRRVVTLTGPGGTGKTRLAIQAAAELVDRFKDGVFFVTLAAVTDPDLVVPAIAGTFGTDQPVQDHIGEKRTLLVLDNLEQVVSSAPHLATLVRRCPNLHLLMTSRAPLRIEGEREYAVDPLPDADAIDLFREAAANAEPADVVAEICRRLDNLPLAVELAAARTRVFSPRQLLERLGKRLPLLVGGRRDMPERQRTLRSTIEWSYDLLTPQAQGLFGKLGVFPGSFGVEAAERIADAMIDDLEHLVEHSLVRAHDGRFSMLETIREFAVERIALSGEHEARRDRHARYFLALAEQAAPELQGENVGEWLRHLAMEEDNVRAALAWMIESSNGDGALRLCLAMTDVWHLSSHLGEGVRAFDAALSVPADVDPVLRAEALQRSGILYLFANRREQAVSLLEESLASARKLGAEKLILYSLLALGSALSLYDSAYAKTVLEEAREMSARAGDPIARRRALHLLGELLRDEKDFDRGAAFLTEAIEIARGLGSLANVGGSTHSLADLEFDRGDLDRAEDLYRQCLRNAVSLSLERHKVYCVAGLAAAAARRGDLRRAAHLWGAMETAEQDLDFRLLDYERDRYERVLAHVPTMRDIPSFDEAVTIALSD